MSKNETVRLSELDSETIVSYEDAHYTLTVAELRERVAVGDYRGGVTWYVANPHCWSPTAKQMVEQYIENEYDNGMYEGWDERAFDCMKSEHYDRIQAVLDEAFKGDHATKYWMLDGAEVEIDVPATNIR
jgi:hypothetical protein